MMRGRTALPLGMMIMMMCSPMARAQTANASPTAPAPAGLPGIAPGISRVAPSSGPALRDSAGPVSGIVPESDQQFLVEQRKADREMQICKGC